MAVCTHDSHFFLSSALKYIYHTLAPSHCIDPNAHTVYVRFFLFFCWRWTALKHTEWSRKNIPKLTTQRLEIGLRHSLKKIHEPRDQNQCNRWRVQPTDRPTWVGMFSFAFCTLWIGYVVWMRDSGQMLQLVYKDVNCLNLVNNLICEQHQLSRAKINLKNSPTKWNS